jgi:hypothetical protein
LPALADFISFTHFISPLYITSNKPENSGNLHPKRVLLF